MVFSSATFLLFLLPVLAGFHLLRRQGRAGWAAGWLLGASWIFYAWWEPSYLLILWASILANWWLTCRIGTGEGKQWLVVGLALNLGLLLAFKHSGWLIHGLDDLIEVQVPAPDWALPIGLSFITFQQISRLVDVYRGHGGRVSLREHALFISFFPQLIAGPIVRYDELVPQLARSVSGRLDWRRFSQGMVLFIIGLLKKLALADPLAGCVDPLFAHPSELGLYGAWVAALSYTFQLYFDFSGYCDMASGLARMFGVELPWNFDSPYRARNIIDFWRRWHISLGTFLRDYIYIPLGGSRRGAAWQVLVLLLVMALVGLWHGAGTTFLVWGLYHGLLLSACHLWRRTGTATPSCLARGLTFLAVVFGWVLFRSSSLADALRLIEVMLGMHGLGLSPVWQGLFPDLPAGSFSHLPWLSGMEVPVLLLMFGLVLSRRNSRVLCERFRPTVGTWLVASGASMAGIAMLGNVSPFLYFDF